MSLTHSTLSSGLQVPQLSKSTRTRPGIAAAHHPLRLCNRMVVHAQAASSLPIAVQREVLTARERLKLDTADDLSFYDQPRIVQHVDDTFRRKVSQLYRQTIPADGAVLDLMSSWVSHLPEDIKYSLVVGHGMNAQELRRNKRLDRFFIRDFNKDPNDWAEKDDTFDAVLCCVSVQYMQQPECVFAEIQRVLKPGGVCIITFSSRLFYSKAIQGWRDNSAFGRMSLVKQYFQCVKGFTEAKVVRDVDVSARPPSGWASVQDKFTKLLSGATQQDPFHAVLAYKEQSPK